MDRSGYEHSDQSRVTEVFRLVDNLNLEIDVTMEDPIALAEPWVAETLYFRRAPASWALSEISCSGDHLDFSSFESFLEEETGLVVSQPPPTTLATSSPGSLESAINQ